MARALKGGLANTTVVADAAAVRQQRIDKARKLLTDGLATDVISERLGLHGSKIAKLPEACERQAALTLHVADESKARRTRRVKGLRRYRRSRGHMLT